MHQKPNKYCEFALKTDDEYIKLIEEQTHGRKIKDFETVLNDEFAINSISDSFNIKNQSTFSKSTNTWLINENIENTNFEKINSQIIMALEGGTNSITLPITKHWQITDFEKAFNNIFLDYIFINFQFNFDNDNIVLFLETYKKYIILKGLEPQQINGIIYSDNKFENSYLPNNFINLKYAVFIEGKKSNTIIELVDLLADAEQYLFKSLLLNNVKNIAKNIVFEVNLSSSFYHNIIKIRALKIVWFTILKSYDLDINIFIKAKTIIEPKTENNLAIIAATNQATSAIIAGVDMLEIEEFGHDKKEFGEGFAKRISRNIQNILKTESKMEHVADPTKGSYFIENLTQKMSENIWKNFQETQKI